MGDVVGCCEVDCLQFWSPSLGHFPLCHVGGRVTSNPLRLGYSSSFDVSFSQKFRVSFPDSIMCYFKIGWFRLVAIIAYFEEEHDGLLCW